MKKLVKAQKGMMIKTKKISKIPKQQDGGATPTKGNTKYEYGRTPFPGPNQLFVNKTKTKGSGKTVTTNATNELVMNRDPYAPPSSEFKTTINKTITDKSGNSKTKEIKGTKRKFDRLYRQGQKATEYEAKKSGATKMKTGGMVNANAKVSAIKSAGSKGVKSGVNPKASASKVAKGKVGGTSKAPKTAVPKAQYGGVKNK
jgi:hypothetical protein